MSLLERYRGEIADIAMSHLGAHCVWGASGNYPNAAHGVARTVNGEDVRVRYTAHLTMKPNQIDPVRPYLFAAECRSCVTRTCNGKNLDPSVRGRQPFRVEQLRQGAELDEALRRPDWYIWPRVNGEPGIEGPIVYGESCAGKQHFDCVGFVNHCIFQVTGGERWIAFLDMQRAWNGEKVDQPFEPGDILLGPGHQQLAIVIGPEHKVHAKSTHHGVVREPIGELHPDTIVIRPDEDFLLGRSDPR